MEAETFGASSASAVGSEIRLPQRVSRLTPPPVPNFTSVEAVAPYVEQAKSLVVNQKALENGAPLQERQLRQRFSVLRLRDLARKSITKHDVAVVFDGLLRLAQFRPPALAKAVLNHASGTTVDELWLNLGDNVHNSGYSGAATADKTPWLDIVTRREDLDYIRLLCHTGVCQPVLDDAIGLALSRNSLPVVELLLRYGACASVHKGLIRNAFRSDNVRLARILLAAPTAMTYVDWQDCLLWQTQSAPSVFTLCLLHHPSLASAQLLLDAVGSANLPAVKIMLANPHAADEIRSVSVEACRRAHVIESDAKRSAVLMMLAQAGMVRDTTFLQEELGRAVRLRQSSLIRVLVDAGVSLDANANNALGNAIGSMAFDILESFTTGDVVPPLTPSLDYVPKSASEEDILRLFMIFRNHVGDPCDPLHRQLIRAVRAQRTELVQTLLSYGAAIDFQESAVLKDAIRQKDLDMLRILFTGECKEDVLAEVLPTALNLDAQPARHEIVMFLLTRGSPSPQTLADALQRLVSATGERDLKLIQLLLDHNAPLDGYGDEASNCLFVCTKNGDLQLLDLLCAAGPPPTILAQAVPLAFQLSMKSKYKVALRIMLKLLSSGAEGLPVHKTLLDAAKHDQHLNFARALLNYRGDANYKGGAPYAAALDKANDDLLSMMCGICPPTQETVENVLSKVVDPGRYQQSTLELLLGSAPAKTITMALKHWWNLADHKNNPFATSFIPLLLRYGLDVNVQHGSLLSFAVQSREIDLLKSLLSAEPSLTSLANGFQAAVALATKADGLTMMELLLIQAKSVEIGQSQLLPQQTYAAIAGNSSGLQILLRHQAAVDFNDGEPVRIAAEVGCLKVLALLVEQKPSWTSIRAACQSVLSSAIDSKLKQMVFERLLNGNAAVSAKEASQLLAFSLSTHPTCEELPALLLAQGAEPDLETCQIAFKTLTIDRYVVLIRHIKSKEVASNLFKHIIKASLSTTTRHQIYECLLPNGIAAKEVSAALISFLKTGGVMDLGLLQLLLRYGADTGHENGVAFRYTLLDAGSVDAFMLLVQHINDDATASVAFAAAKKAHITQSQRTTIFRSLLKKWNIRGPVIQETLASLLKSGRSDPVMLQMLLQNGADPNKDGAQCFILACVANAQAEFRALSSKADINVVSKALMNHFRDEGQVVSWLNKCFEEHPSMTNFAPDELLFDCLRTFPKGTTLLKLLLNKGVSASATRQHSISAGWPPEPCTALIWALSSRPKIDNEVILTLLDRAGDDALPAYSTPSTAVSAAVLCLLDQARMDILRALICLDEDQTLACNVPGASFEQLAVFPAVLDPRTSSISARLSLPVAALFLGNFEAFRLLSRNRTPNDGLLHNAAFFALPKFVAWLLKTDDANAKSEDFDGKIPLAVACEANYIKFCKFGNERDFRTRQRETMELLAPRTDLKYHEKHKTLLHIALHNGPETTTAMLGALKVASDPNRHTKYRYTDPDKRQYSPREYVMEIMGCETAQKQALLACLSKAGLDAIPGAWL